LYTKLIYYVRHIAFKRVRVLKKKKKGKILTQQMSYPNIDVFPELMNSIIHSLHPFQPIL